jgi:hypothetical protein
VTATFTSTDTNYSNGSATNTITINRAALSVTADFDPNTAAVDPFSKLYDGNPYTGFTVRYAGFVNSETPAVLGGTLTFSGVGTTATAIGGPYTVTPGGLTSSNYQISFVDGSVFITGGTLSGSVLYANTATPFGIPNVTLAPVGNPLVAPTTTGSGLTGNYSLLGFGAGPYTVTPTKTAQSDTVDNGITPFDASQIAQHVVHLITLGATAQQAADVSGNGTVSSFDASLIAQYLVHIANPGVNNTGKWIFDTYSGPFSGTQNHDFSGILKGDASGDWDASGPQTLAPESLSPMTATRVSIANTEAPQGSQIIVPVRIDNLNGQGVVAYQLNVAYDPAVLNTGEGAASVTGTLSDGLAVLSNAPQPGLLKVVVYGAFPKSGDGVYVNLSFTVRGAVGTTSALAIQKFNLNDGTTQVVKEGGQFTVTAASGPVFSGRVLTSTGAPIQGARVTITSTGGQSVIAISNGFGYVQFAGLIAGQMYTLTTTAKTYTFASMSISASAGLTEMQIIAQP